MSYNCYLFKERMPEVPAKLAVKIKGQNKSLTLLDGTEINMLKAPGLTEIDVTLNFPMLTGEKRPEYYLGLFAKAKVNKEPTQFILTRDAPSGGMLFDTNIKVSVESYTINENAEQGFDVSVSAKLKQYRDFSTKTVVLTDGNSALLGNKGRSADSAPKAKKHTVMSGETLFSLSMKYFGSGAYIDAIYEANKDVINNPNYIYEGQVLVIPE